MAKRQVRTLPEIHVDIGSHNVGRAKNPRKSDIDKMYDDLRGWELHLEDLKSSPSRTTSRQALAKKRISEIKKAIREHEKMYAKNPAPRIGTSRPTRASQRTGQKPTKRLVSRRRANTRAGYFPNPEPLNIKHPKNIIAAPFWIYQTYNGKREFIAATKSAATGNALAGLMQKNAKTGAFFDVVKAY